MRLTLFTAALLTCTSSALSVVPGIRLGVVCPISPWANRLYNPTPSIEPIVEIGISPEWRLVIDGCFTEIRDSFGWPDYHPADRDYYQNYLLRESALGMSLLRDFSSISLSGGLHVRFRSYTRDKMSWWVLEGDSYPEEWFEQKRTEYGVSLGSNIELGRHSFLAARFCTWAFSDSWVFIGSGFRIPGLFGGD